MSDKEKDNLSEDDENKKRPDLEEDEDFGLPGLDDDSENESSAYQEDEVSASTTDTSHETDASREDNIYAPVEDAAPVNRNFKKDEYAPMKKEKSNSAAPIIITLLVLVVVAAVVVYFLFFRDSKPEPVVSEPIDTTTYVVETPVVDPEPIPEPEPEIGVVNILSGRTSRSYVVVASFFDEDMAKDYAKELADQGLNTTVIPPFERSKFNRVAVESYDTFQEATKRAEQLKGQYKEDPWPLKY